MKVLNVILKVSSQPFPYRFRVEEGSILSFMKIVLTDERAQVADVDAFDFVVHKDFECRGFNLFDKRSSEVVGHVIL